MMKLMRSAWNIVEDKVSDGANNIEDTMGGALGYGKDKVANAYGDASLTQSGMRFMMLKKE